MKVYSIHAVAALLLCTACTGTPATQDMAGSVVPIDSIKSKPAAEEGPTFTRRLWADLQKMNWQLAQVSVGKIVSPSDEKTYTLEFRENDFSARFCNQLGGGYVLLPENRIRLEKVISTEMFCGTPDYLMAAEGFIKDGIYEIDITKGYLTLAQDNNSLVFSRKSTPEENPMAD
ncbi:MAG: META domain-containing protein [Flavobacteriales bacterium]